MSPGEDALAKADKSSKKHKSSKPHKHHKHGSSSHSSKKRGEVNKGKPGPAWRLAMEAQLTRAKVHALEAHAQFEKNPEFRKRVLAVAGAVSALLLLLFVLQSGGSSGGASMMRGGGGGGAFSALGGGGRASSGGAASSKPPGALGISKREREKMEPGFDVSGSDMLSVRRRYGTREEFEAALRSGRPKLTAKEESCFKGMATQVRRDAQQMTVYQPRKVFDLPVLQRAHKALGWAAEADMKQAGLVLKGVPRVTFRQLKEGKQYYDMVASLGRIGSKKKTQLATLRSHVRKFKCSFESLHIQPRSYDMNRPGDCAAFFKNPDKGRMWVLKSCKSGEGSKGMGISVLDDLSSTRQEWAACEANAFNYVAQAYIERPLLLNNRKFDMRAYLFVASTKPYIVFANPGYVRRSLAEYKPTSTEKNDVLTNYHVQMERPDFKPSDAMWDFGQFMAYLRENNQCQACGDVEIQLFKISRLVFDAGRSYYKRWSGSFQLVGLDFMMDAYLNLMFIEGNVSPGIGNHGLKWKRELMDDLIQLMYEQTTLIHERPAEFDMRIGERAYGKFNNYWELVINEHHEKCNNQHKFDPCQELKPEGVPEEPELVELANAAAEDDAAVAAAGGDDDDGDD